MSKTRDTGNITNVIKVDATGNVSFVSGSTTLATISTSGQMSGSLPALSSSYALSASYVTNAETLDGLDSTVFTLTSSFNTTSASLYTVSSSAYDTSGSLSATSGSLSATSGSLSATSGSLSAASGSLSAASGSFNTRVTALEITGSALSSSILSVSASSYLTSGSLSSASGSFDTRISTVESKYATTGSNTFIGTQIISGSILQSGSFTSTGTLTAQTLVVQTITSSVVYSSGSNIFGNSIGNSQVFTGSVLITGSLSLNSIAIPTSASLASTYLPLAGGTLTGQTLVSYAMGGDNGFVIQHSNLTQGISIGYSTIKTSGTSANQNLTFYSQGTGVINLVSDTQVNGIFTALSTIAGTTIYGSTAVCSAVGKFTSCIDAGSGTFSGGVTATQDINSLYGIAAARNGSNTQASGPYFLLSNAAYNQLWYQQLNASNGLDFWYNGSIKLTIASTGAATFACSVTSPYYSFTGAIPSSAACTGYIDYSGGGTRFFSVGTSGATKGAFSFYAKGADNSSTIPLLIDNTGVACFSSTVCAGSFYTTGNSCFGGKLSVNTNIDSEVSVRIGAIGNTTDSITCSTALRLSTSNNTAGQGVSLAFTAGSTKETGIILAAENTSGQNGDFLIRTYAGGANYPERFRLTSAGNVGIGTCCPTHQLHVVNSVKFDTGLYFNNSAANGAFVWQIANESLRFGTCDTERMRITNGGNVLIGTQTASNSTLQIVCVPSSYNGMIETVGCSAGTVKHFRVHKPGYVEYGVGVLDTNAFHISTASTFPTSNGFTMLSGGNIGFGETTPGTDRLVILGNNTHNNVWLRLKTAGCHGVKPAIHFDSGLNGTNYASKVIIMGGYSSPDSGGGGALVIYTNDTNETSQQRMCIDPRGAVTIMGALAKGSGSFRICHPLSSKVNTHALVHSFIEGPNADLIYSGHTKLIGGVSCINIDCISRMTEGTFEALNRCVRIFTTNESSWSAVKGKVCGNIVIIESQNNTSEDEISWMVIGERHDQHMFDTEWTDNEGRVITEPELVIVNDDDIVA